MVARSNATRKQRHSHGLNAAIADSQPTHQQDSRCYDERQWAILESAPQRSCGHHKSEQGEDTVRGYTCLGVGKSENGLYPGSSVEEKDVTSQPELGAQQAEESSDDNP